MVYIEIVIFSYSHGIPPCSALAGQVPYHNIEIFQVSELTHFPGTPMAFSVAILSPLCPYLVS